jgi:predicted phosphoadenosine phosphosulfate sulfurtransferase
MRTYLKHNVYEAAIKRINRIFDEFPQVVCTFSGGKDSTTVLELVLEVAREREKKGEKGRLPMDLIFIDQEAEWQTAIDYIRDTMLRDEINPMWIQCPIRIFNATSTIEPWLKCWDPEKEGNWIREKEDFSIHDNVYGTDRFGKMFTKFCEYHYPDGCAIMGGVRAEESPARKLGLTTYPCYKDITWGAGGNVKKGIYTFYPCYDWSYTDVWKAIFEKKWNYCKIYDYMYQYGVPVMQMRVSNVHHESAIASLFYLQEVEADTWERICKRLPGISTAGQLQNGGFGGGIVDLPFMFNNWKEYRNFLLEKIILDKDIKAKFKREFARYDVRYLDEVQNQLTRVQIECILANDHHHTKLSTFDASHGKWAKTTKHKHSVYKMQQELDKEQDAKGS